MFKEQSIKKSPLWSLFLSQYKRHKRTKRKISPLPFCWFNCSTAFVNLSILALSSMERKEQAFKLVVELFVNTDVMVDCWSWKILKNVLILYDSKNFRKVWLTFKTTRWRHWDGQKCQDGNAKNQLHGELMNLTTNNNRKPKQTWAH